MEFQPHTAWTRPRLASVLWLALLVDAVLVALHLAVPIAAGHTIGFFDLGAERNLPTWWSSGKLAVAGLLFALVSVRLRRNGTGSWFLGLLAASLLAMSLDELASIHEKIGLWVDGTTRSETKYTVTGYWIVFLGVPAAIAVAGCYWHHADLFGLYRSRSHAWLSASRCSFQARWLQRR